jgi:flagellar motor protein MotB
MKLLGCGLAEDAVVVRALGDSSPIEPPGSAINRRVDFDVLGRPTLR